jgi:hypothetical protein
MTKRIMTPEELQSALMQTLTAKLGGGPAPDLRAALLARLGTAPGEAPLRAALMSLVSQRRAEGSGTKPSATDGRGAPQDQLARMRSLLQAARQQLGRLQSRSEKLALALGACPVCWGEDPVCLQCEGAGQAGWTQPDPAAFAVAVEPALRKRASAGAADSAPANPATLSNLDSTNST